MKTFLTLIVAILLFTTTHAQSSEVATIPQGQTFNLDKQTMNPKDSATLIVNAEITTNKAIYNGNVVPVFAMKKSGKLFIIAKSKNTGNYYRKYLKTS